MGLLWYKINKKGIFSGTKSTKRDLGGTKSITRDFSDTKSTKRELSRRRGAVVKGVEHISSIVLVYI